MNLLAENNWLTWIMGNDPDATGTPRLIWANFPESWGVFVLALIVIAIIVGVFWFYISEIKTCPTPVKLALGGLRLFVLLLLVVMFLKPSVYFQQINEIKPTIALLRDNSLSIDRGDTYRSRDLADQLGKFTGLPADQIAEGNVKRSELVNKAFQNHPEMIRQLREKGALRVIDFSDGTSTVALIPAIGKKETDDVQSPDKDDAAVKTNEPTGNDSSSDDIGEQGSGLIRETIPELVANGLATDLWQALREALDDPNRLSSIILISEGQHNGSEDPLEIARKAGEHGIPIFTIGLGDPNPPKNLAVSEVYVRDRAYPDEPFEIEAILQTTQVGRAGMPPKIQVALIQQEVDANTGKPGPPMQIKSKDVDVPSQGGRMRVDFDHLLVQPGKYVYTIQVETLEGETETADNSLTSSEMEVVDEKVKVLLISGLPSWDYQQVYRLLQRDSTIDLSCWLQSMDQTRPQEGNSAISRLPENRQELREYNVVIMMDPNPIEFGAQWMELLKDFCRKDAGGVLFMAGPQFTGEFVTLNRLSGIRDLLPVRFGDNEFIDTIEVLTAAKNDKPGRMLLVNHNMDHPVMSFRSDPAETLKIWNLMPSIYWSFPTISSKPTARVLLERGDQVNAEGNQPLLVSGRYGSGAVLYMGFQGTWKWRPIGIQAQYFDRFWIQVVRYLVETRSLQGARRGFIDTEKSEFELGDRVILVGRVLDEDFEPSSKKTQKVVIRSDDGRTRNIDLKLLPNQKGSYEGTFVAQRIGNFEASIPLGDEDSESKLIEPISFRVVPPSVESGAYWLNQKLLADIAAQSGGQYFRLDQLDQVPGLLPVMVKNAEFNSPLKPIWSGNSIFRWFVFGLPVVLLSVEWIVRKWYKLL